LSLGYEAQLKTNENRSGEDMMNKLGLRNIGLCWAIAMSLLPLAGRTETLRVAAKPAPQPDVNTFVYVMKFGAKGDGLTDDTGSILQAIAAAPIGSVLFFPKGNYLVPTSCSLQSDFCGRSRAGIAGLSTGADQKLFHLQSTNATTGPHGLTIRDLCLGSAATAAGASLLKLTNIHHLQADNLIMLGGYYGVYL
jgi:polygalacturonase